MQIQGRRYHFILLNHLRDNAFFYQYLLLQNTVYNFIGHLRQLERFYAPYLFSSADYLQGPKQNKYGNLIRKHVYYGGLFRLTACLYILLVNLTARNPLLLQNYDEA